MKTIFGLPFRPIWRKSTALWTQINVWVMLLWRSSNGFCGWKLYWNWLIHKTNWINRNILSWSSWRAQDKRQWTGLDVIPNIVGSEKFLTWKIFYVVARGDIRFVFKERGWWVEWKVVQNLGSHCVGCIGWALSQVRNEDFTHFRQQPQGFQLWGGQGGGGPPS